MLLKPIFNVYVSQWWRQRPAWQSTFYSQSSFSISCSFWIVLLGFPFAVFSATVFWSLLKKRFHTAGCSVKQSNGTESLIFAHSLSLSFIPFRCVRVCTDNWQSTFKSSVGFLCHAKPSQSKRSQITYEHNLHIRRCRCRCHKASRIFSNKGDKFVFMDACFFQLLLLLFPLPVTWLTLINLNVTSA